MKKLMLSVLILLALVAHAPAQNASFGISQAGTETSKYLPGDVVKLMVEAPIDTARLSALMPDNQVIQLEFNPRTNLWYGSWEVPLYFPKGSYNAKLIAFDFEGNRFEGQSSAFFVTTPSPALAGPMTTEEAESKEKMAKRLAAEALILAEESQSKLKQARELLGTEAEKVAVAPPPKPAPKARKPAVAAKPKPDVNRMRVELIARARAHIARREYKKAKEQIQILLGLQPDDPQLKAMLNRLNALMKIKEGAQ